MKEIIVSPSILAANPLDLGFAVREIEKAKADWIHIDVMDGHFVNNLSFGLPLVKALKAYSKATLDVHIMVSNPDEVAYSYIEAGADYLTFHFEAAKDSLKLIKKIKDHGAKAGLAIKPSTQVSSFSTLLSQLDLLLVMSVEPGFGGQKFIESTYGKLCKIKEANKNNSKLLISVDGGVSLENVEQLSNCGANVFVTGSSFFNSSSKENFVKKFKLLAGKKQ